MSVQRRPKPIRSRWLLATWLTVASLVLTACGGSGFNTSPGGPSQSAGPAALRLLFAGDATASKPFIDAAQDWAKKSGNTLNIQFATNMEQELSQGFASGNPPDLFTVSAATFAGLAKAGNLAAYAKDLPMAGEFNESLKQSFTYNGEFTCAPKDTSTLALVINTEMWEAAGLTEADLPTTWEKLTAAANKLTKDKVKGLVFNATRDRIGAFMKQAGGWFTNPEQTKMTADSPQNLQALQYVKQLLESGSASFEKTIGAGWGGEAFGKKMTAMTIEGTWIKGPLSKEFANVKYRSVEMPSGPAGKGTLSFTECFGIAAKSKYQAQARAFVEAMMAPEVQLKMARELGVMPSIKTAQATYAQETKDNPADVGFVAGLEYAQSPTSAAGMSQVLTDFDSAIQGLPGADPKSILETTQKKGTAELAKK